MLKTVLDGSLAHQLVNTGNVPLIVGACWFTDAGYDFDSIAGNSFAFRVKILKGKGTLLPSSYKIS